MIRNWYNQIPHPAVAQKYRTLYVANVPLTACFLGDVLDKQMKSTNERNKNWSSDDWLEYTETFLWPVKLQLKELSVFFVQAEGKQLTIQKWREGLQLPKQQQQQ